MNPLNKVIDALANRGCDPKSNSNGFRAFCPTAKHSGQHKGSPELSIAERADGGVSIHCHAGCDPDDVVGALGLSLSDLFPKKASKTYSKPTPEPKKKRKHINYMPHGIDGVSRFPYKNAEGSDAICVIRKELADGKKTFSQWESDGKDGWFLGLDKYKNTLRPLFCLSGLIDDKKKSEIVIIHEGEKCVVAAYRAKLKGVHTTSSGGAGGAKKTDWQHVKGRIVYISPDNNKAGEKYLAEVLKLALDAGAVSVCEILLPNRPDGGDVADWLDAGGATKDWEQLMSEAKKLGVSDNQPATQLDPLSTVAKALPMNEKALSGDSIDMDEWGEPEPLVNTLLPVPAFDIELLPRGFQDYVRDSAYTMQAPYEFTAVSLMCSLGAVLGNRCCIYPKAVADWKVYPNLWGALVGRPSTKKSPTLGDGTKGIYNLNKASIEAVKKANEHAGMRSKIFKKQETVFTNTYADELAECGFDSERGKEIMKLAPQKPEPARYRKYVLNAVTPEKLAMIMADNDNGILVLRDELISWIRALENATGQDARGFMIEAWNACNTHEYATVAHGTIYIEKCCASVLGGIQPPLLANMVRDTIEQNNGDDGLLQRFQMMVYPDPLPNWDYIDKAANKTAYKKMCQIFTQAAGQSGKARFTDEAQAVFVEWYSKNERSIKHEPLPCLESLIGKYGKLMASIALILHVAERAIDAPDQMLTKVDKESALKAVRWCELLKAHARRIYGMGDVTDITNARRVVEMVIEGKLPHPFTLGDLQRKNLSGLKGKQSGKVLELLEQKGWLKLTKKTNPKGKPAVFYTLHPEAEKNLQSPKAPLTKFTIMEKKDNSDNSEGVSSTQDEKTTSEKPPANDILKSANKENIQPQDIGSLGRDGKVILAPENDDLPPPEKRFKKDGVTYVETIL